MHNVKAYFIPYAGGSSLSYYKWKEFLNPKVEPYFIELAGRGAFSNRDFYKSVDEAAEEISNTIINTMNNDDYIIFGHSMGALLAFEVYYKLVAKKARIPKHIFFSGREAPEVDFCRKKIYQEDDDTFLKKISIFGGLPTNIKDNEIKSFFTSILKADFKMLIEYTYIKKSEKIKCDISVLYGKRDMNLTEKGIMQWKEHSGKTIDFYEFEGDHFFINDYYKEIPELIIKKALQ